MEVFYDKDVISLLILQYGSISLFFLLALGIIALPIPDETLMVLTGTLLGNQQLELTPTLLAAYAGSMCGITISYLIGRTAGHYVLLRFGSHFGFTEERLQNVHNWFEGYGKWTLLLGYFIPGVRHFTGIFAGLSELKFKHFALFAYTGAFLWVTTFIAIGYFFGTYVWQKIECIENKFEMLTLIGLLLLVAYLIYRYMKVHHLLKWAFALLAGIVIYTLYLAYPIYRAIKTSEKMIAATLPFEQHPVNPEMTILVAGDSTATGVGATEKEKSIAGRLGTQFPKADISNIGVAGARLEDLIAALQAQKGKNYNLLVLQIGANDITHFTCYNEISSELDEALTLAEELSTKTIVITSGDVGRARVFHWPLSSIFSARTQDVREIFMTESAKHKNVTYVDLYLNEADDPFEKNLPKYYAPDAFHLTNEGYGFWYSLIQKHL